MSLNDDELLKALKVIIDKQEKRKYTLNILDEIHANENAHTRIFLKLLQFKNENTYPFLELFIDLLNTKLQKEWKIQFDTTVTEITGQENYMDAIIKNNGKWAIIVENKIEGAVDQPNQLDRYVQATIDNKFKRDKIYVVYLTATSEKKVSDISLHKETKIILGYKSEEETGRFIPINYKEHILPLVDKLLQYLQKKASNENVLISAVEQYLDYLTGRFSMRKQDKEYFMDIANELVEKLGITKTSKSEKFNKIEELENQLPQLLENIKHLIYPSEPKSLLTRLFNDSTTKWAKIWLDSGKNIYCSRTYENPYIYRIADIKQYNDEYYWGIDFEFRDSYIYVYPLLHNATSKDFVLAERKPMQNALDKVLKLNENNDDNDNNNEQSKDIIDNLEGFAKCSEDSNYYLYKREEIIKTTYEEIYNEVKTILETNLDQLLKIIV